jgi:hypothetical protein
MSDANVVVPAPGWYADPMGGEFSRWWDGAAWTKRVSDVTPAEPFTTVPVDQADPTIDDAADATDTTTEPGPPIDAPSEEDPADVDLTDEDVTEEDVIEDVTDDDVIEDDVTDHGVTDAPVAEELVDPLLDEDDDDARSADRQPSRVTSTFAEALSARFRPAVEKPVPVGGSVLVEGSEPVDGSVPALEDTAATPVYETPIVDPPPFADAVSEVAADTPLNTATDEQHESTTDEQHSPTDEPQDSAPEESQHPASEEQPAAASVPMTRRELREQLGGPLTTGPSDRVRRP